MFTSITPDFQEFAEYFSELNFQQNAMLEEEKLVNEFLVDFNVIEQIDEQESIVAKQQKQLEKLKEKNKILKYNQEKKKKITNYIQNVHGMIFETTHLPILVFGTKDHSFLSWNRAAAVNQNQTKKFFFMNRNSPIVIITKFIEHYILQKI